MKPKTLQSGPELVKTDDKDNVAHKIVIQVELAGFRRRLASMLYDTLLLSGVLALAFLLPWAIILKVLNVTKPPLWVDWLEVLHIFAILALYFIWHWRRYGQTLAMRVWRLKVVAADGTRLSTRHACLRYALACPSVLLCGVGIVWALFDLDALFLHDRLAKTRVVRLPGRH